MKLVSDEKLRELLTRAWAGGFAHADEHKRRLLAGKKPPEKGTDELERCVDQLMEEAHP